MSTINLETIIGGTIDSDVVTEITVDGDVVWRSEPIGPVDSFVNGQFRDTVDGSRPAGWDFGDATTGDASVTEISVRSSNFDVTGGQACYSSWTGNSSNTDPVWIEQDVDLTGATDIVYSIYGRSNADRSSHRVYVDGTEIANHGTVSSGSSKEGVTADVSGYSGVHTVRFSWVQVSGDNHGGSFKDDIHLV